MISYPIDLLSAFCSEILISSNSKEYDAFGWKTIPDLIGNSGPIGGIYSCLRQSSNELNILLPCDMPLLSPEIIQLLLSTKTLSPIIVPSIHHRPIPVCGIYSKKILPIIENQILNNNFKLQDLLRSCHAVTISIDDEKYIAELANLNTQEDLENAENKQRND